MNAMLGLQGGRAVASSAVLGGAWLTLVILVANLVCFFMAVGYGQNDVITAPILSERLSVSGQSALKRINVVVLLGVTPLNRP